MFLLFASVFRAHLLAIVALLLADFGRKRLMVFLSLVMIFSILACVHLGIQLLFGANGCLGFALAFFRMAQKYPIFVFPTNAFGSLSRRALFGFAGVGTNFKPLFNTFI